MEDVPISNEHATCGEHEGERLRFYCTFHNDVICSICAIKRHKPCQDTLTLTEAIERFEREHQNLIKALDHQSRAIANAVDEKQNALRSLACDSVDVTDKINKMCLKLHEIIDEKKASLLSQLKNETSILNRELSSDVSFLNKMASTMSKVKVKAKRAFQGKSQMETVQSMIKVQNTYCDIEKSSKIVLGHPTQNLTFEESTDLHEFITNLQSVGLVAKVNAVTSNDSLVKSTERSNTRIPDEPLGAVGGVPHSAASDDVIVSHVTSLQCIRTLPCLPTFESSTETESDVSDETVEPQKNVASDESVNTSGKSERDSLSNHDLDIAETVAFAKDLDRQMSEPISDTKETMEGSNVDIGSPLTPIRTTDAINRKEDDFECELVRLNKTVNKIDACQSEVSDDDEYEVDPKEGDETITISNISAVSVIVTENDGTQSASSGHEYKCVVEDNKKSDDGAPQHMDAELSNETNFRANATVIKDGVSRLDNSVDNKDNVLCDTLSSGLSLTETMKADKEVEGIIYQNKGVKPALTDSEIPGVETVTESKTKLMSQNGSMESPLEKPNENQFTEFKTVDHGKTCWIYGVEFLNEKKIIVSDVAHDSLQLFDIKGQFKCEKIVPFTPWGISRMNDEKIVVCSGIKGIIYVYNAKDDGFELVNSFDTGNDCNAIRYVNEQFYIGSRQGIVVFSVSGEKVATIDKVMANTNEKRLRRVDFIAANQIGKEIYLVNSWSGRISCVTHTGELLWENNDRRIYPKGLTLKEGTLFVASKFLNAVTIVGISTGARENDVTSGNIEFPYAIAHHPSERLLAVTKWDENMRQDETREVRLMRYSTQN